MCPQSFHDTISLFEGVIGNVWKQMLISDYFNKNLNVLLRKYHLMAKNRNK
jgi:hypothetical protein